MLGRGVVAFLGVLDGVVVLLRDDAHGRLGDGGGGVAAGRTVHGRHASIKGRHGDPAAVRGDFGGDGGGLGEHGQVGQVRGVRGGGLGVGDLGEPGGDGAVVEAGAAQVDRAVPGGVGADQGVVSGTAYPLARRRSEDRFDPPGAAIDDHADVATAVVSICPHSPVAVVAMYPHRLPPLNAPPSALSLRDVHGVLFAYLALGQEEPTA